MIISFRDKRTQELFETGGVVGMPADIVRRASKKLDLIDGALSIDAFRKPRGNRFHALVGDRFGQYAIAVNDQ